MGTEVGLIHPLQKASPGKTFYPIRQAVCPNMKKTTLEKVARCLETLETRIDIEEGIAERARATVRRMVEVG